MNALVYISQYSQFDGTNSVLLFVNTNNFINVCVCVSVDNNPYDLYCCVLVIYVESIIGRLNCSTTSVLNLTPELTTGDY